MHDFYDQLAPWYHLVYQDWNASIEDQAKQLVEIIKQRWGLSKTSSILDISCGIGTQALGLAQRGFRMTGSDLSVEAITRAGKEAEERGLEISFSVCDMRQAYHHHRRQFDLVISCDNSIPHLLTDDDVLLALHQMYQCARPGGGCLLTLRDYDIEERGTGIVKLYGLREDKGTRYLVFQVWDFQGDAYDLSMYFLADDQQSDSPQVQVMRSRYYAISTQRLLRLMEKAGFGNVERLDGVFFQPVLVGTRQQ